MTKNQQSRQTGNQSSSGSRREDSVPGGCGSRQSVPRR